MHFRNILTVSVCFLLLVSAFECKQQNTAKKSKTKEVKAPKVKVVKVQPVVEEKHVEEVVEIVEEEPEEEHHEHVVPVAPKPTIIRAPKSLKKAMYNMQEEPTQVMSAYEQCKMECRKQRDAVQATEYVDQLRAELALAEAAIAEQQEHQKQQAAVAAQESAVQESSVPANTAAN